MHSKLTVIMQLYFKQESDPAKATFAKVIPTPNNGSAELVPLLRDKVRDFSPWFRSHICYPQNRPKTISITISIKLMYYIL